MKNIIKNKIVYIFIGLLATFSFAFAFANDNAGQISLDKTATKVYQNASEGNLQRGRKAKVTLTASAKPYTSTTYNKLDIVLIIDGSSSMNETDGTISTRLNSAKTAAKTFVENISVSSSGDNIKYGLVYFGTGIRYSSSTLTSNANGFINEINALNIASDQGTNLQRGINTAKALLDNNARSDAKQIIIILTDGVPTYFTYDNGTYGMGNSDSAVTVCTNYSGRHCLSSFNTKPSTEAKKALDSLKQNYSSADIYTIAYGKSANLSTGTNETAAQILERVNPKAKTNTHIYDNLQSLNTAQLLANFQLIINNTSTVIGEDTVVTDIIPNTFVLSDAEKRRLTEMGIIIENANNGTKLTWNIGKLESDKNQTLSYELIAKDEYHGSEYTNTQATLTSKVKESNPFYNTTTVTVNALKPVVEIPAIANNDTYKEISSYEAYEGNQINGTTVLANDLNKNKQTDKNKSVTDKVVVVEDENVVKSLLDGSYSIYKDGVLQGTLTMNDSTGTFAFMPISSLVGEVSFEYYIETTINPKGETDTVYSNNATVTLNLKAHERTNIVVNKTWIDNNNQDGIRPSSIVVNLLANGTKIDSKTITSNNNWKTSFDNVRVYDNEHKKITYLVVEEKVEGYTTSYDGNNIINTHQIEKTTISGNKTWIDNDNQDGIRPSSIVVNLLANGTKVESKTVTSNDNWSYSFANLDKYKDGRRIEYTVKEEKVEGYTTTYKDNNIINTHEIEKTKVIVSKEWVDDNDYDGFRPNSIEVNLLADGTKINSKTITKDNNWTYEFANLDKYKDGKEIEYTIKEENVNNYVTTYELSKTNGVILSTVINTHTVYNESVDVEKIWDDNNNQDGIRPNSITLKLRGSITNPTNGETQNISLSNSEVTITASNNWKYTFEKLPMYVKGLKVYYQVTEDEVSSYSTSYSQVGNKITITNTHTPETVKITGQKNWNDNDNQDGIRPNSITLNLKNGEEIIKTIEVKQEDNWKFEIDSLPKYEDGKLINYSMTEVEIDDYENKVEKDMYNFIVTNTHAPEKISYHVTKVWDDNNDQDGKRPDSITVNLYKNGVLHSTALISSVNNWTYEFTNLDKYTKGELNEYVIVEDSVKGYTNKVDVTLETENKNNVIITNTHAPEKVSYHVTKVWDDNDDQDGIRPDSIIVNLYKNSILHSTALISSVNNWTYEFTNLDKYANGRLIVYTIVENLINGYTNKIDVNSDDNNRNNVIITNIHSPEKTNITINKTWIDDNNAENTRPNEIIVNIYADKELFETIILSAKDNWMYELKGLDKYKNGKEIVYTIKEEAVEGYQTSYDNFTIINTKNIQRLEIIPPQTGINENINIILYIICMLSSLTIFVLRKSN